MSNKYWTYEIKGTALVLKETIERKGSTTGVQIKDVHLQRYPLMRVNNVLELLVAPEQPVLVYKAVNQYWFTPIPATVRLQGKSLCSSCYRAGYCMKNVMGEKTITFGVELRMPAGHRRSAQKFVHQCAMHSVNPPKVREHLKAESVTGKGGGLDTISHLSFSRFIARNLV